MRAWALAVALAACVGRDRAGVDEDLSIANLSTTDRGLLCQYVANRGLTSEFVSCSDGRAADAGYVCPFWGEQCHASVGDLLDCVDEIRDGICDIDQPPRPACEALMTVDCLGQPGW